jgi:hypothetical protein
MVYLPIAFVAKAHRRDRVRDGGAFYVRFSQRKRNSEQGMLRGVPYTGSGTAAENPPVSDW